MSASDRTFWTPWRVAWALLASAGVFAVAFLGWQYGLFKGGMFRTSSFNETIWKSLNRKTADSSCYRGGMAHDLQTRILRAGLTRTEVEKLLGAPDSARADVHEYFLGMCSGLRMDFDTLDVHFTPEGRLLLVRVVQH